jgi:hypothetical protein
MWEIEGYGEVERRNAAWTCLVSLEVRREGRWKHVAPDSMMVGEIAHAIFHSGAGTTVCKITRAS